MIYKRRKYQRSNNSYQEGGEVKGPIGYLKSYYSSDKFKERAAKTPGKYNKTLTNPQEFIDNLSGIKAYTLPEGYSKGKDQIGSRLWNDIMSSAVPDLNIPKGTNIILDPDQAKTIGLKVNDKVDYLINDVFPHEAVHYSGRELSFGEELAFASRNRNKKTMKLFDPTKMSQFFREKYGNSYSPENNAFSTYLKMENEKNHDLAPDENYSDLNTFRYLLWKQGIYDARSQDFNKDFLEKAKKSKYIQDSFNYKRLKKTFSDDDIIYLMNNIAQQESEGSSQARYGGSMKSILGYSKNSPYQDDPFIDIHSPEGLIDMSQTDKDLIGMDNLGNTQFMRAGTKSPYKFEGDIIREIPLEELAKGGLTASKAKEMLRDGTANGKKLTKKQKGYFGWVAGGKKQVGGAIPNIGYPGMLQEVNLEDALRQSPNLKFTKSGKFKGLIPLEDWNDDVMNYIDKFKMVKRKGEPFVKVRGKIEKQEDIPYVIPSTSYPTLQMGGNPYTQTGNQLFDFLFEEDEPIQSQEVQSNLEEGEVDLTELREKEQELNDREQYMMALQIAMEGGNGNPYETGQELPLENVGNPAKYSYNYLIQKGYRPEVAAGIVGNIQHESNFNPFAVGDRGKARGLAQWHPDRYAPLSKKFNLSTIQGNLDAIDYELNNSEVGALEKINSARTPEEAALLFDKYFERSAGLSTKQRMNTAKNVHNFFK